MFKRIKIFLYLSLATVLIGAIGCKKGTFDINSPNPNVPSDVSPKFILSGALKTTAQLCLGGDEDYLNLYMGYWSVSGDYIPSSTTETYQTTTDYFSDNWNTGYLDLKNYAQMQVLAASDPNAGSYTAMGKIMEAFYFERLVDQYNDCPYTDALQGGTVNFPTYDKAANVYDSLIVMLNDAINIINQDNSNPTLELPGNYDILFGGNMTEWIQFANTLKLKMALNVAANASGSAFAQNALAGTSQYGFLGAGQDAAINPGYSNSSEYQQNPFWYDMGFSTSGAVQNNESYYRACSYIVNFMFANNDTIRLYQVFAPNAQTPAVVLGRPFGSNISAGQDNQHISAMGPGLLQSPSAPAVILPAYESLYMQARATMLGYLTGGPSAASLYQTGMEESFRLLQVPNYQSVADNYIATNPGNSNVSFTNSNNQMQTVLTQEWVADCGFDPLDSWNIWRATGVPTSLPVSVFEGSVATHIPYRLLYPTSEYTYNSVNVDAEGTINNMTSTIFWMP